MTHVRNGAPQEIRPAARRVLLLIPVLALLAGCGSPPETVGAPAVSKLASPAPVATGPSVPVVPGNLPSAATAPPVRLAIPKLGLTARVDPVGIDTKTGDFAVPPSIDKVGWYRYGPGLEAAAGSIVVAGHVDSAEQGKGAFFKLRDLAPGDPVSVTGANGVELKFTVVGREIYEKKSIPLEKYFARDGAVRLTLITCGGPFDERTSSYRDNVVVTAQPVGR